ncbi:hypothetical protein [Streptomyces sp. NPDC020330]|uniref:hypothetical protein n=1 Tax=unclassified Streptomyces TaxID=2593676 RepID=UPI00378C963B
MGGQIAALRAEVAGLVERLPAAPQTEAGDQGRPAADPEHSEAVYQRIGNSLAALSPDDGPLVTTTLDDRTPHTGDTADS